jgi:hypothetical protein
MMYDGPQNDEGSNEQRRKIDFDRAPEDFFLTPGRDAGIWALHGITPRLKTQDPAPITGFAASQYDHVNTEIEKAMRFTHNAKMAKATLVLESVPILMQSVHLHDGVREVGGKYLLSGASGTRLRNKYANKTKTPNGLPHEEIARFLVENRPGCHLPDYDGAVLPADLPIVIEAKNQFNFFHFLTETLPQLCLATKINSDAPILIHPPKGKVAGFPRRWIDALFPELASRVRIVDTSGRYDRAIGLYEIDHYLFQADDGVLPDIDPYFPQGWAGADRAPGTQAQAILNMNTFSSELLMLRARAHHLVAQGDFDHLPRRFWVARRSGGTARARPMHNENKLLRQLQKLGFEKVHFEDLAPLEQVAIMARAEMMVSYHGAGFANMLFAGSDTHVIEIGHLQTAIFRWPDFMPLAHAAGCKYTSFFADFYKSDPEKIPTIRHKGLLPVALSDTGVNQVTGFIANALGEKKRRHADGDLRRVAQRLNDAREWKGLAQLLDTNEAEVETCATLLIYRANCANAAGDTETTRAYLERAWTLDQTRPALLERMIKHARRQKDWTRVRTLLATHKTLFPKREKDFTGKPLNRP